MLTERPVHSDLKTMLIENEPFAFAHLIKFERPSRLGANGKASTSKERYTYLTDASRDVNFDDGSKTLAGVANGSQVYIANKVLKVSGVAEQTEAKASTYSITLDGNGIGALVTALATITSVNSVTWDIAWDPSVDVLGAGFREGDKVTLSGAAGAIVGDFNIANFRANNTIRITKIDTATLLNGTETVTMSLASEEIKSILLDKNLPEYASFVNREVFIYRAYFQEGAIVGAPVLIFKGIISNVGFEETDTSIQVTWGMTSHWGDFAQVKGRITSDDFHRALDQNGSPQPQSALKIAYAYDKGFSHAETSINLLSTYTVQVEKQDVKAKKGFLGIGSKVKVKKYFVNEDRNTELDFQLQAKTIPVIYGVRNTTGIPIFADTLNDDSSTVFVAYALSEGEIGGIYDVYVNGNSLICNDKSDFDARSTQTPDNTVELICRGRADRGDVLGGITSVSTGSNIDFYAADQYLYTNFYYNLIRDTSYKDYVPPVATNSDTTGRGVVDGESIKLTSPQEITLDFFSGKSGQKASSQLVSIAKAKNFKIQNDYWTGTDTAEYWGPNHRMLDTAYVVGKFKIEEGETEIPQLEFITRGKSIECYNYDNSYSHYNKVSGESQANFLLGDIVTLYNTSDVAINTNVQIIDKWTFTNADGTLNTRFRFSSEPNLGLVNGVPTITKFYMKNAANNVWTMITHNFVELAGSVPGAIVATVTGSGTSGSNSTITYDSNTYIPAGKEPTESTAFYSIMKALGTAYKVSQYFNSENIITGSAATSTTLTTKLPSATVSSSLSQAVTDGTVLASRNTVRLPTAASATDSYYNGHIITIYRYNSSNDKQIIQQAEIVNYAGATKVATIDGLWDVDYIPTTGDTMTIVPKYRDSRVSINPAMQALDYITSTTYGRGLDPITDLDLPSWLEAGRACDTRSNVTVLTTNTSFPVSGHKYRWPATGALIWQGTVVGNDSDKYLEFTDNLGKLTNAWNNWKSYKVDELVYKDTRLYKVTAAGVKTTEPTHTSGTINGLQFMGAGTVTLTSTNGGPVVTLVVDGNPIRALKNGSYIPGYSLYDCDAVDYWRLLGWDELSQRYVTRHQTNMSIDTSLPLFDNMNSLLEHFGGILRYSGNKYYLEVEDSEGPIAAAADEVRNITADHIIGKIRLSDEGVKGAFNSLTAAYADPANKFEARNISFFNTDYLKADRNVPKKGNVSVAGITNYYNTRILADKYLNKSRFGLTISFNMAPRGLLLLAGKVIQLQYPRYGWVDKKFRISNLTHQDDCTVDVVAEEYDDSFYILSKISKQSGSGLSGSSAITGIAAPTGLRATSLDNGDETFSGVQITWINNPLANTKNVYTELYSSYSSKLYLTIDSISGNVLTSSTAHGLKVGELITSQVTMNGLELGKSYFIKTTPSSTTFTLSETKNGAIKGFSNGTSLGGIMLTASLLATLPIPTNSFIDSVGGINGRVVKYYWVRHKVIQG